MAYVWNVDVAKVDTDGNFSCDGTITASGFVGDLTGDVTGDLTGEATLTSYTVATLPDARIGGLIFVSDGAAGSAVLAVSDGTDWLRCDTLAAVSAT